MSDETEQKFGLAGNEQAQGYEPLVPASPVDIPEPDHMSERELTHARRSAEVDWGPEPVERDYVNNQTSEATPSNQVVGERQAAADLAAVRAAEADVRKQQGDRDLAEALDTLNARDQGQQPPAQDPSQPVDQPQPSADELIEGMDDDQKRAYAEQKWAEADKAIENLLQEPLVRERVQQSLDAVRNESKQEVERAYALSGAVRDHYQQATTNLLNEAGGIIGALYPELTGLSGEQLKGALQVMAQQNPQRVQQLQHLASRAQGLVEAQARQAHEQQRGFELQRYAALEQFTAAEEKRFEEATKYESPEAMKAVRSQVYDVVEKSYGIPKQAMNALYSGEQRVDSAAFVRSAAFQLMLTDAVKYRLAQRGVTQARANPIPKVQRPGVASDGPRVHEGDLSAAASRFNLPGGNEGQVGLKNAAAWLTARRGRG